MKMVDCPKCCGMGSMESLDPSEYMIGVRDTCYFCSATGKIDESMVELAIEQMKERDDLIRQWREEQLNMADDMADNEDESEHNDVH